MTANFCLFLATTILLCMVAFVVPECRDSVIRVRDLVKKNEEDLVPARLQDVRLESMDTQKRPFCDEEGKPAIRLPGLLRLLSGELHLRQPLPNPLNASRLRLALTLEQQSMWVGRICERGKSQSAFLSDEFCSLALCTVLPDACKVLQSIADRPNRRVIPLAELLPADQLITLQQPAVQLPLLEGYWRAEAELRVDTAATTDRQWLDDNDDEQEVILARLGSDKWHFVATADAEDEGREEL